MVELRPDPLYNNLSSDSFYSINSRIKYTYDLRQSVIRDSNYSDAAESNHGLYKSSRIKLPYEGENDYSLAEERLSFII